MKEHREEALRWLRQAENDLEYAKLGFKAGFFAQTCFQCQQVCEKALKAVHYGHLKKRIVYGHSLVTLAKDLDPKYPLMEELAILDQYYIPTRYPNGLPGNAPYEVYTKKQAEDALSTCNKVINSARQILDKSFND